MSELDRFRQAVPGFKDADDEEVVREISRRTGQPLAAVADTFGIAPRGFTSELVRQVGAGFAVDTPEIVGGALQYFGDRAPAQPQGIRRGLTQQTELERRALGLPEPEQSLAYRAGAALRAGAAERAPEWEPDMRDRGDVARFALQGARAVAPVVAGLAPALVPGGAGVSATMLPLAFAGSAARDVEERLLARGVDPEEAAAAARRVFGLNLAGETVGTVATLGAARAITPVFRGARGIEDVAQRLTDTRIFTPAAKAIAANAATQTATENIQELGGAAIEQAYGGAPVDYGNLAYETTGTSLFMSLFLGPLSFGGARQRAQRSASIKEALYGETTPPEIRAQAMDLVMAEARRQGVAEQDVNTWFDQQLAAEDARTEALRVAEEQAAAKAEASRTSELAGEVAEQGLIVPQDLMTPGRTNAAVIERAMGIDRERPTEKEYTSAFEEAYNEPSGFRVSDPETGIERELSKGEYYLRQVGSLDLTEEAPVQAAVAKEEVKATTRDPRSIYLRDTFGVIPTASALQLLDAIEQSGLPVDSDALAGVWSYAAEKPVNARRLEKALEKLDAAVIDLRKAADAQGAAATAATAAQAQPAPAQVPQRVITTPDGRRIFSRPVEPAGQPAAVTPVPSLSGQPTALSPAAAPAVAGLSTPTDVAQTTQAIQAEAQGAPTAALQPAAAGQPAAGAAGAAVETAGPQERVVRRRRVVTPAQPATAYVAPEAPTRALSMEDTAEIEALTGARGEATARIEDETGRRADMPDMVDALPALLTERFKNSKDPQRDATIATAYLTAMREAPKGSKEAVQRAIGQQFGVGAQAVRKIGNTTELVNAGKALGYTEAEVRQMLDVRDTTKAAPGQARAVGEEAQTTEDTQLTEGLRAAGVATGEGEAAGFGYDDARFWAAPETTAEAKAEAVNSILNRIDELQQTIEDLESQGMAEAADIIRPQVDALNAQLEGALKAYEDYLTKGTKAEPAAPAKEEQPKAKPKAAPAVVQTPAEQAGAAWNAVAKDIPGMPKWGDLSKNDQETFVEFGPDNWTRADVVLFAQNVEPTGRSMENIERMANTTSGSAQAVRSPSVKREVEKLLKRLDSGDLTPEAFAARVDLVLKSYETAKLAKPLSARQRGADYIRQRLLEAKRRGDLSEEAVDFAEWFILKNPALVDDLAVSIRSGGETGASGSYEPFRRLMTLIKESSNDETAVHEIMHHLERMMPPAMQSEIRKLWLKSFASASKGVDAASPLGKFFEALRKYHFDGSSLAMKEALWMLKEGEIAYSFYQYVNPSEFWAVNSTRITQSRFGAKGSVVARIKQWLREFGQRVKSVFGLPSDAPILKAIDSLVKGDGKFVSDKMLMEGVSYNMFAGKQALASDQYSSWEKQMARYSAARLMASNGASAADIWRKTGWERNPDGKWRFEISDKQAKLKQDFGSLKESKLFDKTPYKLGDVLDHPELFAAYPELAEVTFLKDRPFVDVFQQTQGWFTEEKNEIAVTPYAEDPLSTLLHEVQHWVQMKEKFAPGGNPEATKLSNTAVLNKLRNLLDAAVAEGVPQTDKTNKLSETVNDVLSRQGEIAAIEKQVSDARAEVEAATAARTKLDEDIEAEVSAENKRVLEERQAAQAEWDRLVEARKQYRFGEPEYVRLKAEADAQWQRLVKLPFTAEGLFSDQYVERRKAAKDRVTAAEDALKAAEKAEADYLKAVPGANDLKYAMYKMISGEAEARNTQRRQGLTARERRRVSPEATADVPYETQVITDRRTGRAASLMNIERNAPTRAVVEKNVAKLPKKLQSPARNVAGALGDLFGRGLDYVVFTSDLIGRAEKAGMTAARRFSDALAKSKAAASERERRVEKIADMYADVEEEHKGSGPGSVNEFLFDSTRKGKWGYGQYRDADMGAKFDALGPKAQAFVKAVFKHGDDMLAEKKRIVLDATNSEYDAMIAFAEKEGDKKTVDSLKLEKAASLKRFNTLFGLRTGLPYAPIKRTGGWAVVGRSAQYEAAVAANDAALIRKLEQDPDHYQVSFVDSKWEARTLSDEMVAEFGSLTPTISKRAEAMDEFNSQALLPALTKLRARVDAERGTSNTKLLNIISQLYLESLAEDSARKSEMRRRGIYGRVDMLQSFTTQGRADANFISSVEYSPEIQESLQQMRTQSKAGDVTRRSELFDEISTRYTESLDYTVNPWVSKLTSLSSKYFLATSPGYYLQNLTQPFMMSVPAMAGKHDYAKVGAELFKAYSELGPLFKNTKLFDQQFDFTQVPSDVRAAVDELVKRGKIDIGLATEINEYKVDADGKLSQFAQRLNKGMRLAIQKTESINRLSTAMAAYRLELARTKSEEQAIAYADRILTETHGDYTAFNAPRIFNTNFGKVALQFRKFQLIQIAFYAKLFRDAFTNPAERAAALRTLGYSLAHSAVFAGALGLPGYAAVAAIAGVLFGDEDEPYDLTEDMRKALGPEWSQLIMRGVPTLIGMDLSGKIGSGQMLSVAPFADLDLTTQTGVTQAYGTIAGGATLGMVGRMLDGVGLMAGGNLYRGFEQVMPKGVGDMLKAGRITTEGLTRRNGDVILPEEDVSAVGSIWTALGVPSPKVTETYQARQSALAVERNFTERTTEIKNQYARAYKDRDTQAMAEARRAWKDLQDAKRRNGLKAQPMSGLLRAPKEQRKREKTIQTQID